MNIPALVSNLGAAETNVGVDAVVGSAWTRARMLLRDRATVAGYLSTQDGLLTQNQTTLTGPMISTTVPMIPNLAAWTVEVPAASVGDLILRPGGSRQLAPGRAGKVVVSSRARLSLSAGTYLFDELILESGASLEVDASAGPTFIYVQRVLIVRGNVVVAYGGPGDLLFGYLGTETAWVNTPLRGTLVAPNATANLASLVAAQHTGAVFARNIEIHQGNVFRHVPFAWWKLLSSGACRSLTPSEISAMGPHPAGDFYRFCSDGTLSSGRPLTPPTIFSQLRSFEAAARQAEARVADDLRQMLKASTFAIDPSGEAPEISVEEADALLTTSIGRIPAVIGQRDQAIAAAIGAVVPTSATALSEVALATWWASVRASLWIWTPPSRFDASCEDAVRGEVGRDIAEALARNDTAGYVQNLSRLVKALECTSSETALNLGEAFVNGYDDAVARFPPAIRPAVTQALNASLTNVFLILVDMTKFMGPSPISRWLTLHVADFARDLVIASNVVRKTGLWVQHRTGDSLVQLPTICEVSPVARCVSLTHLLHALVTAERLGLGTCTIFDMVTRTEGFNPAQGYFCEEGLCSRDPMSDHRSQWPPPRGRDCHLRDDGS